MMKLPVSGEAQAQAQPTTKINITKLIKSVSFNIYISHADPPLVRHKTVSPFRRCSGGAELHATLNNLSTPKFKELSEEEKVVAGEEEEQEGAASASLFYAACLWKLALLT